METFSALLSLCAGNSPVTGEFPAQRPVARNCDVFFDLCLNKRLSKQSRRRVFETPSRSLWRHCNIARMSSHRLHVWLWWCGNNTIDGQILWLETTAVHSNTNVKWTPISTSFGQYFMSTYYLLSTYPGLIKDLSVKLLLKGINQDIDWSITLKKIYFNQIFTHTELLLCRYYGHGLFFFFYNWSLLDIALFIYINFAIHLVLRVPESTGHVIYLNIDATPRNIMKELLF